MALVRAARSGTFTPADGSLLVVQSLFQRNGNAAWDLSALALPTGGGLTWTQRILYWDTNDYNNALVMWTAPVVTGVSMSVSTTAPTNTAQSYDYVLEYTGANNASPVGLATSGFTALTDGVYNPSLGASPAATSEVLAAIATSVSAFGNIDPVVGTGWTELHNLQVNARFGSQMQARTGSTDSTTLWDDLIGPTSSDGPYDGFRWIALEIKEAGGAPPVITLQPTDQTVNSGATATFSVTATGATGYQWEDNSSGSFASISGATSSSYAPTAAYSMQGRQYRCVVTNGSTPVTSSAATLRVAFNLTGTGPRTSPFFGAGPFAAGAFGTFGRGTASAGSSDLQASPTSVATATAALTTSIRLAASATGQASATGALSTGIVLGAATASVATASAALSTSILLQAQATASASASAALSTSIRLASDATSSATATAALSTGIRLAATAASSATVTAALADAGTTLAAAAVAQASCTAALSTGIRLAAAPSSSATASAALSTGIALAANAQCSATATSALATQILFAAQPAGQAAVSAALSTGVRLQAAALAQATLTAAFPVPPPLAGTPGYLIAARRRAIEIAALHRGETITARKRRMQIP